MPAGRPKGYGKTGGRKPGVRNKTTSDIKLLAREYGPAVILALADLALNSKMSDAARVAAMRELLDRGYGKSPQTVEVPDNGQTAVQQTTTIITGVPRE